MNNPKQSETLFHIPLGLPFCECFVEGLLHRCANDPARLATTEVFVSSGRMADGIKDDLRKAQPTVWPKVRLVSDLANDPRLTFDLPDQRSGLERQLLLAQLIGKLSDQTGAFASQSARFSLAKSLDDILSELQRADQKFDAIDDLDLSAFAEHWTLSKNFLSVISAFLDIEDPVDDAARQVQAIRKLALVWEQDPPSHDVIVAGSTGSREDTLQFMKLVSALPTGAVILPGYDDTLVRDVRQALGKGDLPADHPQAALAKTMHALGADTSIPWVSRKPAETARNELLSLAMAPAPVTDLWISNGPQLLPKITGALENIELLEAATPREEALSIALRIRQALEDNLSIVLLTPDRNLARQVTAELQRWSISPDDSAGRPLHQTPPGVFLRLLSKCLGRQAETIDAIALLKHPLTFGGTEARGTHLLRLRVIEAKTLRGGPPLLNFGNIADWIARNEPEWSDWWGWITQWFDAAKSVEAHNLDAVAQAVLKLATQLSAGSGEREDPEIWQKEAGQAALNCLDKLKSASSSAGDITLQDWSVLLRQTLADQSVRDSLIADPRVAIWGTLEARNLSQDVVILAGLNEGVWPALPRPSPWLNRPMRKEVGLQSPERAVGLAAHDFQIAAMGKHVVLSHALRDGDAPTVPSRWILRLTNLLTGLGEPGKTALAESKSRAQPYLDWAKQLDRPQTQIAKARRPAPVPPKYIRPKKLPVTQIQNLIRDPYTIYARYLLNLRRMDSLGRVPDVLLRGTALHKVVEAFAKSDQPKTKHDLLTIASEQLREHAPWPVSYHQWLARIDRISDWLVDLEKTFAAAETIATVEEEGRLEFGDLGFTLTAKPDRINQGSDGLRIIDYKTGILPTDAQVKSFDKQLPLTKLIAEAGGFHELGPEIVVALTYISLKAETRDIDYSKTGVEDIEADFKKLMSFYLGPRASFPSRTRPTKITYASDYDQLSRQGEWEDRDPAEEVKL